MLQKAEQIVAPEPKAHSGPKVLFYIPQLDHGGPDRVFYELLADIPTESYQPILLTNRVNGRFWSQLQGSSVQLHSLNARKRFPIKSFAQFVRSSDAKIVLCTLDSIITASISKLLYRLEIEVVARPANHVTRNSLELARKRPIKYGVAWLVSVLSLHLAKLVVCQSEDIRKDLRRYQIPERSMTVIGNPTRFHATDVQEKKNNSIVKFVSLGRLSRQKGYDILIDSIALLPRSIRTQIAVEIYGEGPDRDALEQQIKEQNVGDVVELCGFVEDTNDALRKADFFVSSSRYEGFPNAVLEALSMGISVIASDCPGGTREIVIPGKTGWLYKAESCTELCRAIERALELGPFDPKSIQKSIAETSSTPVIVSKYTDVFNSIASK